MTIRFFSKSNRCREVSHLANFCALIDASVWPTSERYYQAQKGVIGADESSSDVWGETANLASRLESHGLTGETWLLTEERTAAQEVAA
jgi:predicted NAD-dependent protein-ADP-ribosyltransferase YbiA (DUF1768 family)